MVLTPEFTRLRQASPRQATNYGATKDLSRDLIYFFNQMGILTRRAEQDVRRYQNALKPFNEDD